MPTTLQMLKGHTPVLLEIIMEMRSARIDTDSPAERLFLLAEALTSPDSVENARDELADTHTGVREALEALVGANGKIPETQFARDFGPLEIMGDDRLRESERWLDPQSVSEILYFNGLISRGFEGTGPDAYPIIYMPSDIVDQFPRQAEAGRDGGLALGPAQAPAHNQILDIQDHMLNDLGSVMGCLHHQPLRLVDRELHPEDDARLTRRLLAPPDTPDLEVRKRLLLHIVKRLHLFKRGTGSSDTPMLVLNRSRTRHFLALDRHQQRTVMWQAWQQSPKWNDLCETPVLECRNTARWQNDPRGTRDAFLRLCRSLRLGYWYRMEEVVAAIHAQAPDFQRPSGDYDSWYLWHRDRATFVRGFAQWALADGELVRFLLGGPMYWLGALRQAEAPGAATSTVLNLTRAGAIWLGADAVPSEPGPRPHVTVNPDFTLQVPLDLSLGQRFRIERFAWWQQSSTFYRYQITQRSLEQAFREGIGSERILEFLRRISSSALPRRVENAIRKFGQKKAPDRA